jgi:hypothetical protein
MLSRQPIIQERATIIPIKQNLPTSFKDNIKSEYSLKKHFFDPTKSSPPNEFMIKLYMRMSKYNMDNYVDIKDDSLDKE